jgi:hypothetical protein
VAFAFLLAVAAAQARGIPSRTEVLNDDGLICLSTNGSHFDTRKIYPPNASEGDLVVYLPLVQRIKEIEAACTQWREQHGIDDED